MCCCTHTGKSLYDHDGTLRDRLYVDFLRALQLGINSLIMKYDDNARTQGPAHSPPLACTLLTV